MRQLVFLLLATALVLGTATVNVALAVPAGKTIEYTGSTMGKVVFDGAKHSRVGFRCTACHREGVFPKMREGAARITMDIIYRGKACGACHNGTDAFGPAENCGRCHKGAPRSAEG